MTAAQATNLPETDVCCKDGIDPKSNPILSSPYEMPKCHWELDESGKPTGILMEGRRRSVAHTMVPRPGSVQGTIDYGLTDLPPHDQINLIRSHVAEWRGAGYPGISSNSKRLLIHWRDSEEIQIRPYFCQLEALETLIFLSEADDAKNPGLRKIKRKLEALNADWNEGIYRLAVKMATATGKTMVMAMIILWKASLPDPVKNVLVLTPNLTVSARLERDLDMNSKGNKLRLLLPRSIRVPAGINLKVANFQSFTRKNLLAGANGGEDVESRIKTLLSRGMPGGDLQESMDEAVVRMTRIFGDERILVINDEAHHCYELPDVPMPDDARPKKSGDPDDRETREFREDARKWFSIVRSLSKLKRTDLVVDLSATPMYLAKPRELPTELFPWTVSDYPLIEAVESGLTKIPCVPIDDDTDKSMPVYRDLYNNVAAHERRLALKKLPKDLIDILDILSRKYGEADADYSKAGITPVMIIVANSVKNANVLYKHMAGYVEEDGKSKKKRFVRGSYPVFSNVDWETLKPVERPPTLLIHSELDSSDAKDWDKIKELQKTFIPDDEFGSKRDYVKHLRDIFNTIGQSGMPGEHVRCVISVSMLTEGWDAKTVTHILGFRAFKSQLLCEQVAGRALRRTSNPVDDGSLPEPEGAGIFGVPFNFMGVDAKQKPLPKPQWSVYSVDGRNNYRMTFPNIRSYVMSNPSIRYSLNPKKVIKKYPLTEQVSPSKTTVGSQRGREYDISAENSECNALFRLAANAMDKFEKGRDVSGTNNRLRFVSMLDVAKQWIKKAGVDRTDIPKLADRMHFERVSTLIADSCTSSEDGRKIIPVFMDDDDPTQDHALDTSGIAFHTSLPHRYPKEGTSTKKSELNAAACHSSPEADVARVLDGRGDIEAWTRNFRLGWTIPYMLRSSWKSYTPDFVARVGGLKPKATLLIEVKGPKEPSFEQKMEAVTNFWLPAVNASDDPACSGIWDFVLIPADKINDKKINRHLDQKINDLRRMI
ncbi:MAG: DEAD/DEAH box helicase family protein [Alphaproteobacteria bacterium]|nr:DEAD/DEAH box helicase family protein [Alphaproteobacteria bacterium]